MQCSQWYALYYNVGMNVQQLVREIRVFMERNAYSQLRLSQETGIPQPTISRALKAPVRVSSTHRKLCKFAGIPMTGAAEDSDARHALLQTVLEVWDGTTEHAQTLARLIKAGATLEAYGAYRASKRNIDGHR